MTQQEVPARQRPTLEAVAALAGVSRATVSRVVNGSPAVDPTKRAAVQQAINELHYVPNLAARALMTGRTYAIALVADEPDVRVFSDPYFADIVRGVSVELADAGYRLTLAMIQRPEDRDHVEQYLLGHHVDGVLLISAHSDQRLADRLLEAGIPLVEGGRPVLATPGSRFVDNDNVGGAA
ncbi:MAG: LacI family DNA-binding transcriptional regulator, partial [Micropruina sp.]